MTRERMPVIYCDHDDGDCTEWERDFYAQSVSKVGGVSITREHPAPGWSHTRANGWETDLCPDHQEAS